MINNIMIKSPVTLEELNIRYLKLMNGDSIIAFVHEPIKGTNSIPIEEPMKIAIDHNQHYTLEDYMPFTTSKVYKLDSYNILMESPVDTDMKATYLKIVLGDEDEDIEFPDGDYKVH